jgi:hypothetical protein
MLLNSPIFYVVYYILISGVFSASCFKPGGKGVPRSSRTWTDTYDVEVSTTDDLFHVLKTMWGPAALLSTTDSTEQLVWCLIHMWSMLHVISVICYLTRICSLGGVGGLGIRTLTLDTETSLYTEDRGLQVPMVLEHDYIQHTYKCFFRSYVLLDWYTNFEW